MSYNNRDFLDMATCPVCVQVLTPKPVDNYSVREIMHIESHVQNPIIDKELEMFL